MRRLCCYIIVAFFLCLFLSACSQKPDTSLGNLCVQVEEEYGLAKNAAEKLILSRQTGAFMQYLGFTLLCPGEKRFDSAKDGILRVSVKGNPTVGNYTDYTDNIPRYTGAEISAMIRLERADSVVYEKAFTGNDAGIQEITNDTSYLNPDNAPFDEALENAGYYAGLAAMAGEMYGLEALILAGKKNKTIYMERGSSKVQLIANGYVASGLKKLTGENFGIDFNQWENWWQTKGKK